MHRYAVYFAPSRGHELTHAAAAWLGRSAYGDEVIDHDAGGAPDKRKWVGEPARYGFHATLKPPFRLAQGMSHDALVAAFEAFCAETPPLPAIALEIGQIGPFFALMQRDAGPGLGRIADAAVRAFEPFRAPLSEAEIARHKPEKLSARQRQYLDEWGYPYIFDEFRFHMTLTGPIEPDERDAVRAAIDERFGRLVENPVAIDALALFGEPAPAGDFQVLRRSALGQPVQAALN